ncbi:hypothetical protein L596_009026 [Steinernema carpocapsae]|uniref:Uncharacterized protein n=1 Tax=Steinernema carpocapsae TaxID=34508 RepID=A0A4U5PEQ3_STECR|nr:hypothetical protein L596_009026 [Steinernema carpocapsae]
MADNVMKAAGAARNAVGKNTETVDLGGLPLVGSLTGTEKDAAGAASGAAGNSVKGAVGPIGGITSTVSRNSGGLLVVGPIIATLIQLVIRNVQAIFGLG